jgi:hypothetical protein
MQKKLADYDVLSSRRRLLVAEGYKGHSSLVRPVPAGAGSRSGSELLVTEPIAKRVFSAIGIFHT